MKEIPLSRGLVAQVSDQDYERVSQFKWYAISSHHDGFYAAYCTPRENGKRRTLLLHRFILDAQPGQMVDHADGDGLNCQRHNIRICDNSQNMGNRRQNRQSTSRYKGVHWHVPNRKWLASIQARGKKLHIGMFTDEAAAARAYDAKARELFGEFARTNF